MACIQEGATTSNYFTSFEVCLAHLFLLLSRLHKNIHIPDSDSSILLYQTLAVSELSHLYMYGSSHVHTTPWPSIATDMAANNPYADVAASNPYAGSNEAVVPPMPTSSSHYPPSKASKYSQEADEDKITPAKPTEEHKDENTTVEAQEDTNASGEDERKDAAPNIVPFATDLERNVESGGYVLDEASYRKKHGLHPDVLVKKTRDGKKVLIPQPSNSRDDPLNWSRGQKLAILVVLVVDAFSADYSAATGASALLAQADEWHITPDKVNHATAG
jgi:hypothetical protein